MAKARIHNSEITQNAIPKIGGPIMKQLTFNWEAEDICNKLQNFILEVNNVFESCNMLQTERITITKMTRQERPTILRNIDPGRTRKM